MKIRQPVISILAHVDHGKTSLLDYVRGSRVAAGEAGGITQHVGASEVPAKQLEKLCGKMLKQFKVDVKFPGLLFIDTPGHAAFTVHRKRGGSLADIAILVVDVTEGFKPQTDEALTILKQYKTPFIVAANKIDKISGWRSKKNACFLESFPTQTKPIQDELDTKIYELIGQMYDRGFGADRFDRVSDFTKQIPIVPICALTGEGMPELLSILAGLTGRYLEKKLEVDPNGPGKGTILEVKEVKGLGTTIDVILYDGMMKKGDMIVIGHPDGPIVTKVKALLKTQPLKEIRVEKKFKQYPEIVAASGVKVSAPDLEKAMAGNTIISVRSEDDVEKAKAEVMKDIEAVEIDTEAEGVLIRADTIGSLEAMIKVLGEKNIPIKKAKIGAVNKTDVAELTAVPDEYKIIFAFNANILSDAETAAKDNKIKILSSKVIYRLLEEYDEHVEAVEEEKKMAVLNEVVRPAKIKQIPGFVFRQSKPAIAGFEVVAGILTPGVYLMKNDGTVVGTVRVIQEQGKNVKEAKVGTRTAVSIEGATLGRNLKEGDTLYVVLKKSDYKLLLRNKDLMSDNEKVALQEIRDIMIKKDKFWDLG